MAATYTVLAPAVTLPTTAAAKTLFQIYNADATQKLNITRVWMINTRISAVTAAYQTITLGRHTTVQTTGATAITPFKHDTNSAGLVSATTNYAPTTSVTLIDTFRVMVFSGDEFAAGVAKMENLLGMPNFALLWNSGYGDTNISPIVLNQNEGIAVTASGVASGVGAVDIVAELYTT